MEVFDKCLSRLKTLTQTNQHNAQRNEATTRLQLIDRLFFDCLGWEQEDAKLEERYNGQYAGYTFFHPRAVLIVEAKREGKTFELPIGGKGLEYSLQSLMAFNLELKLAIEQVSTYCQQRGVPCAVVANGHQLAAFLATREDGMPPFQGKAIVFSSLSHMSDEFLSLWNLLSKPAFELQAFRAKLHGSSPESPPAKLSGSIRPYPGTKGRNPFQTTMKLVSDTVLEDIIRVRQLEPTFMRECYCESDVLTQQSTSSRALISARYSALFDSQSPGPQTEPASLYGQVSANILAQAYSRRPVLLIGDVGVGKSMFIKHLLYSEDIDLRNKGIVLYIDFGFKGNFSSDLKGFILQEIAAQLRDEYLLDVDSDEIARQIYDLDLKRFQTGIYGKLRLSKPSVYALKEIEFLEERLKNREEHLRLALEHIQFKHKRQIILFLDNTDQRPQEDQQVAFLVAQEIADRWPCMVFVTLRPETFHASQRTGSLTGYHLKAFTIDPPRLYNVFSRRLRFALKFTRGKMPLPTAHSGNAVDLAPLGVLIGIFLKSIRRNPEILRFVEQISGGNVRQALEMVRAFFGSGHVDTEKIIGVGFGYDIPLHEIQRAIIYGDNEHFDPERSYVANVFDVTLPDRREHFLLPLILDYLQYPGGDGDEQGFVSVRRLYERFQRLRFVPEQIDSSLLRGIRKKLVESTARRTFEPGQGEPFSLRPTAVGVYHIQELTSSFTYIDAVTVDTPILDKASRALIKDVRPIKARLERAGAFLNYLDTCWLDLSATGNRFDWPEHSSRVRDGIERVYRSVRNR